jgi:hypothetical protein
VGLPAACLTFLSDERESARVILRDLVHAAPGRISCIAGRRRSTSGIGYHLRCRPYGVGFPLARVVGVICLATGALIDAAIGPHAGKGSSELGLLRTLGAAFCPGDVMLADAVYCNYFLVATMLAAGVDVLFEQNGARNTDFRRGLSLGRRDHLVSWTKSKIRPEWMTVDQYAEFPDELRVREVLVDGQILVTTLLNHRKVRKGALDQLYAQRWNVELDLRNIKTTLGVEVLRCLTPRMVEKELWVHLLAYNLIRLLMAQAALDADVHPRQLSFKHTVQLWAEWTAHRVDLSTDPDTLFCSATGLCKCHSC